MIEIGISKKITELIEGESERGLILILAAYLEEILGFIIRSKCLPKVADTILELRRPAGDFDSRILLCEAFGLIDITEASCLQSIRKIRNSAAHFDRKGGGFNVLFDSDSTIDQVKNMHRVMFSDELDSRDPEIIKDFFVAICRALAARLYFRSFEASVTKIIAPKSFKARANEIRAELKNTSQGEIMSFIEEEMKNGNYEPMEIFLKEFNDQIKAMSQSPNQG